MCRRNHLLGCCCAALGIGVLLGAGLESGLVSICVGVGLILAGLSLLRQK